LADVCLLRGEFTTGWPLYEARWAASGVKERQLSCPPWDGGPLYHRRILIHAEQGFGDTIQFARYAALVASLKGEVVIECSSLLVNLLRSAKHVNEVVAAGDPLPLFDTHLPMLSLPLVLATKRETIPGGVPYLFAETARIDAWKHHLGQVPKPPRIGVAWRGNPGHPRARSRDLPFQKLAPLLEVRGATFCSLQMERGSGEDRDSPGPPRMYDFTNHIVDFADMAAFTEHLDLIISVDTAVAHLGGALGRPVWTLLPFVPDWRWGLEEDTTQWYPTMRLFRQPKLGDWDSVIQRVAEELRLFVKS
jgi:hypothetical protein